MQAGIEPKKLVRESYDREAARYAGASEMQSKNLLRLIDVVEPHLREDGPPLRILDAGCGLGNAIREIKSRPRFKFTAYRGVDLSPEMIRFANERFAGPDAVFSAGDLEHLAFAGSEFDLAISNSVLHWLNQPALGLNVDRSLKELHRVLKPGGLLGMSVAGAGTGKRFNRAYRATVEEMKLGGPGGVIEDPIGCMQLHEIVGRLLTGGFDVLAASLEYEPVMFSAAADYANAVRAYGFEMFTAHAPAGRREEMWEAMTRRFTREVDAGPYCHDQYMIYVIAKKR